MNCNGLSHWTVDPIGRVLCHSATMWSSSMKTVQGGANAQ